MREFHEIAVPATEKLALERNILGYHANIRQLRSTANIIANKKPDSIFMVGGTCAAEIAPVSWLNQQYEGNLTVFWFDAHGDLNTPASSPSKHFHGMPLRTLLGEGDEAILAASFSSLTPRQVILVGTRDLDEEEQRFITAHDLSVVPPDSMNDLAPIAQHQAANNIYVHIDLDVLDPDSFRHQLLSVPGGLTQETLLASLRALSNSFNVVGFSIVEYVPKGPEGYGFLEEIVDLLSSGDG